VADEQIKIEIVLDDGSVKQGFAKIIKDGESAAGGLESAFLGVGKAIAGLAAAYLSVRAIGNFFESATKAAIDQENAVTKLNNSLKLAGSFSEEASKTFRDFADSMQLSTNIEDEQVLALASLARNYTKTNEAALNMTKTAIDLAAATGVDAETALRQLGGTLSGVTGQLGKLTPELKNMTEAQLKAGAAVDVLGQRFQGAAAGQINTFSGRIDALKIQFGELLEVLGGKIVQSPAIIALLGSITQAITSFTGSAKNALGSGDIFKPVLLQLLDIGMAFTAYVIQPIEYITQIAVAMFRVLMTGFQSVIVVISAVGDGLTSFISGLASTGRAIADFASGTSTLAEAADTVKNGFSTGFSATEKNFASLTELANKSYNAVNNFGKSLDVSDAIGAGLQKATDAVNASGVPAAFKKMTTIIKDDLEIDFKEIMAKFTALQEQLRTESLSKAEQLSEEFNSRNALAMQAYDQGLIDFETYWKARQQIEDAYNLKSAQVATEAQRAQQQINEAYRQGLLSSLSAGIVGATKALATGKNAFQGFSNAVLPIIGNMAIQIGTTLLGVGLGINALRTSLAGLVGGPAIAAGLALIAVGALLQNLSSGSAMTDNSASTSGAAVFGPPTPVDQVDAVDEKKKSQITVNVQGDVLDSRESGLRIVELINDAFDTQGARVTAGV